MSARRDARLVGDGGAAVIEAALVLPLVLAFVMGAIDFGFLELRYSQMSSAARDGSRVGILKFSGADTGTGTAYDAINTAVRARLAGTNVTSITVKCYSGSSTTIKTCALAKADTDTIEVTVNWSYSALTFIGTAVFGSTKTFATDARMTIVGLPS